VDPAIPYHGYHIADILNSGSGSALFFNGFQEGSGSAQIITDPKNLRGNTEILNKKISNERKLKTILPSFFSHLSVLGSKSRMLQREPIADTRLKWDNITPYDK
jgi:hypothetical protein